MAIDYIKALQTELSDVKGKLAESEGKLKEMQSTNSGAEKVASGDTGSNEMSS